jgi:hypothetical protein
MQHLHDELLLLVLKSASPRPLSARRVQAAVCKRWESLVRREEVCWLQVRCGCGPSELVDVGRGRTGEEGALVLPVRFEATKRSQLAADSSVEARLARAVQLALLLLRRSVAGCAVGSLQLHQHSASDLRQLLPLCLGASDALGRHEPRLLGRRLLSLHLSHASLPAGLAQLLRGAGFGQACAVGQRAEQRLQLWSCRFHEPDRPNWAANQLGAPVDAGRQVGGEIADLDLDSLSWAAEDAGRCARLALLLDARWRGARRLCLFLPQAERGLQPGSEWVAAQIR